MIFTDKTYLCIDLKSFYASVECVERNLDPLLTNLVVADKTRTEKTICLAVTPSLKSFGISGRARLFEVVSAVKNINQQRRKKAPGGKFTGKSCDISKLKSDPATELDYIVAPPRMAHYIKYSTMIYEIYLKYVSDDDILVYSIDEVFMDITPYLNVTQKTPKQFAMTIIQDVFDKTGITATCGIGTNMYLAKIAMDITAKKMPPDKNGVRIASLDEMSYRRQLWQHRPITDFWRIGPGYRDKLAENRMYTMGDIAKVSTDPYGRRKLKKLFGINSKMLVDHAWGYEPCTIKEAKSYVPTNKSLSTGQVLKEPYDYDAARLIVWEMSELLALDLVEKRLVTNQVVLTVGYDTQNLKNPHAINRYKGEIKIDNYGRKIPKYAHGSYNLSLYTSSAKLITEGVLKIYDETVNKKLTVRRINIVANNLRDEKLKFGDEEVLQLDMFTDYDKKDKDDKIKKTKLKKERNIQEAVIKIKHMYGKNAIIKGANLKKGATSIERNSQIGGHKA